MAERQLPVAKEPYPYEPFTAPLRTINLYPVYFTDEEVELCSNKETSNAVFVASKRPREWDKIIDKILEDVCKKFNCSSGDCVVNNYNGGWVISLPASIDRYDVQKFFAAIGNLAVRAFEPVGVLLYRGRPVSFSVFVTLHNIPPDMWSEQTVLKLLCNLGTIRSIETMNREDRYTVDAVVLTHDVYLMPLSLLMNYGTNWANVRVTVREWDFFPDDIIAPDDDLRSLTNIGKDVHGKFPDDNSARDSMCFGAFKFLFFWTMEGNDGTAFNIDDHRELDEAMKELGDFIN